MPGGAVLLGEGLPTPQNVRELEELRLPVGLYAAFEVAIIAVLVAVWLAVGTVIFCAVRTIGWRCWSR